MEKDEYHIIPKYTYVKSFSQYRGTMGASILLSEDTRVKIVRENPRIKEPYWEYIPDLIWNSPIPIAYYIEKYNTYILVSNYSKELESKWREHLSSLISPLGKSITVSYEPNIYYIDGSIPVFIVPGLILEHLKKQYENASLSIVVGEFVYNDTFPGFGSDVFLYIEDGEYRCGYIHSPWISIPGKIRAFITKCSEGYTLSLKPSKDMSIPVHLYGSKIHCKPGDIGYIYKQIGIYMYIPYSWSMNKYNDISISLHR